MNRVTGMFVSRSGKAVLLVVVAVVALVAGVHAYLSLQPGEGGARVAITSPPLEFSMEVEKTEYRFGDNITIKYCARNISNQTITVTKLSLAPYDPSIVDDWLPYTEAVGVSIPGRAHYVNGLFHFGLAFIDSNGTEIFREDGGDIMSLYDIVFEPGGYLKQTFIAPPLAGGHGKLLPTGTYQLRGILHGVIPGVGISSLETPTIAFAVT